MNNHGWVFYWIYLQRARAEAKAAEQFWREAYARLFHGREPHYWGA
jgi:hypothetical protein